jgi:S-adenosyl-L-methionine hydrolase (adenosine-forming)
VAPFDVLGGALLLEACVPRFPTAAVHVAVVDPGVGTARRPICVRDGAGRRLLGPDNGLLTPFLGEGALAWLISDPAILPGDRSLTFHGRDVFAPAAAWIAGGGDPAGLGPPVADPARLDWPAAERQGDAIRGTCLAADPFGNLLTSIRPSDVAGARVAAVQVDGRDARWVGTFGDGAPGELLALWGSGGRLEIAIREGSAAAFLGRVRGIPVRVTLANGGARR